MNEEASPHNQLRIEFRLVRIGGVTTLVAGAVVLVSIFFMGITLSTFRSTDKNDADRKKLLDWYNAVSGNVMSLMIKQVDFALQLVVVVLLLCFTASFLVCNGPTALNVQLIPGALHVRIVGEDLSSHTAHSKVENSSWDSAYSEKAANNSILNSILHSQLAGTEEKTPPICTYVSIGSPEICAPVLSFGFPSVDWHLEALPSALEQTAKFDLLPLSQNSADLPTELSLSTTKILVIAALTQLQTSLGDLWYGGLTDIVNEFRTPVYSNWTDEAWENSSLPLGNILDFAGEKVVEASDEILQTICKLDFCRE
ncbi:unnamed protein product [Phytophthora fragariaefolia]|uniref:Unnamed protein product n=1 Tax=Phytophthora fragariaefolia TaxID=1490495 RepID=A0A9W7D741_9STRA|nr:unnamed protein product [Phytophthora fragariaefolia]